MVITILQYMEAKSQFDTKMILIDTNLSAYLFGHESYSASQFFLMNYHLNLVQPTTFSVSFV